ncbi:unnamed protein product [Orchesella dallaii]|uniref:Small ribosomal subunit protein uS12m n=1 Tax=Orchesella dallaii TaxID=48710 RepID=A0ABP1PWU3_9HEXA
MNITRRAINFLQNGSQLSFSKVQPFSKCMKNLIHPMPASSLPSTTAKAHVRSLSWLCGVGALNSTTTTSAFRLEPIGRNLALPCHTSFLVDSVIPSFQMNLRISDVLRERNNGLCWTGSRNYATLWQQHKKGPHKKFRPPRRPLDGAPMLKGVVLKTLIKKPKKPNSANRKCVLVRLSNGKERIAYVPGIGHNLQEHHVVLVRCGRLQDVPGVKLKCIRGKYDLAHVIKQQPK